QDNGAQTYVWSDRFELRLESWFEVQYLIVQRIAIALNINLSAERIAQVSSQPDISLDIYDRWLRGQTLLWGFQSEGHQRAGDIFRSIIETVPNFPNAYYGLVQIENTRHLVNPGLLRSPQRLREGMTLAKKAVQLGSLDSRAHLCLAWSYAMTGQYDQASHSYINACELNENDPWTLISSAQGLAFCNQNDKANQLAEHVLLIDLNPSPA
ncbi:MAG: trifolitoxin synthesis, TfuA, partial [Candidatus Competibacteraceae bacterium]|nr:trifolitoxin synthesis, TfuA [Candidatus Competibacteraceae bacterium]